MKKVMMGLFLTIFCANTHLSFAEDQKPDEKQMMKGKGMGMMGMMPKAMVVSGDGGVIVQSGNKLLKYDNDLNLVKEAEIPMDMGATKKEMCPMCAKKMSENKDAAEDPEQSPTETASEKDHSAHH